jgi:hypothetical protein
VQLVAIAFRSKKPYFRTNFLYGDLAHKGPAVKDSEISTRKIGKTCRFAKNGYISLMDLTIIR